MRADVLKEEFMTPGHYGCPGCGATLAMKYALEVLAGTFGDLGIGEGDVALLDMAF